VGTRERLNLSPNAGAGRPGQSVEQKRPCVVLMASSGGSLIPRAALAICAGLQGAESESHYKVLCMSTLSLLGI